MLRALKGGFIALLLITAGSFIYATTDPFKDRLDIQAPATKLLTTTQLTGIARAGERLVPVGVRGLIVHSDDAGKTWRQAPVPLASDLLDVYFPTAKDGWVVGHDGVVLHTSDAGNTWEKQFDGRQAQKLLMAHFEKLAAEGDVDAKQRFLQDTAINYQNGPEQALLSVWFEDAQHGFVSGSFGTLFATNDGGKTWESWVERVDIDMPVHYNAIRGVGADVFMASEKGVVFRLDRTRRRFLAVPTGYGGSFFGLVGTGNTVIAYGLRGAAYRSNNSGQDWTRLETGFTATPTAAGSTADGEGGGGGPNGQIAASDDAGEHFRLIPVPRPMLNAGVSWTAHSTAVVVGLSGIRLVPLH